MKNSIENEILRIIKEKHASASKLRSIIDSGFLADIIDADIAKIDRDYFREAMGLGALFPCIDQNRAKEIMGHNFFGISVASEVLKVKQIDQELVFLTEIPFSEKTLETNKDTHILLLDPGISISEMRILFPAVFDRDDEPIISKEFVRDKEKMSWRLVRKREVAYSFQRTWDEQKVLLNKREEIPNVRVMLYTMIARMGLTGDRIFEKYYVRCLDLIESSEPSSKSHVRIGRFEFGIRINCSNDERNAITGLASIRKPDNL